MRSHVALNHSNKNMRSHVALNHSNKNLCVVVEKKTSKLF